jgi:Crinkler effector protein N-terminal domain
MALPNDTRRLFCLIQDEDIPFEITVNTDDSISSLHDAIWEKDNINLRDVVAAKDLVLWKVSRFSRNYPLCG